MRVTSGKIKRIVKQKVSQVRDAGREPAKRVAKLPKSLQRSEHDEQVALFQWAALESQARNPVLALMFAVPNGGDRHPAVAAKLKAEGVKRGVPDIVLPHARAHYHGLFVEMKRADASPSDTSSAQYSWHEALASQGYCVRICRGFDEARTAILEYLSLSPHTVQQDLNQ